MRTVIRAVAVNLLVAIGVSADAFAQSAVGSGPLTSALTDTEPTTGILKYGPLRIAPGVTMREIGWDDNVFDDPDVEHPKEDYVASVQPDVALFTRLRFVQLSTYGASDLTYYRTYTNERSRGYAGRARVDFLLSKLRPFVGGGETRTRTRPNGEIDVRPDRIEDEVSAGVAYDLSPHSLFYVAAYKAGTTFQETLNRGIDLGDTLTRDTFNYQGGIRTDVTPLLSMQLFGAYHEDQFPAEPIRNAIGKSFTGTFRVAPEAVFTGIITASYRDIHYADPGLKPFRGLVGNVALAYPFLELGRFTLIAQRGVEYSFDIREGYYLENTANLAYTHRLFGAVDAQARIARSLFDYAARLTDPPHKDTLDTLAGSLGYNLKNRTRVSVNYEYSRRRSPAFSVRNYQRRRVFLSWLLAF